MVTAQNNFLKFFYSIIIQDKKLQLSEKLCFAQQISSAMEYIQNQKYVHCGLSSMAVYLISRQQAKVGNFEFMLDW